MDPSDPDYRPGIAVVVINWNGWARAVEAVRSAIAQDGANLHVVILDNGSRDDSLQQLSSWLERNDGARPVREPVSPACAVVARGRATTLLANDDNEGFAGGSNVAIRYALDAIGPDFVFQLNSDATMDAGCIAECVAVARETGAAIVGAIIRDRNRDVIFAGADPRREMFALRPPAPSVAAISTAGRWRATGRAEASGQLVDAAFLRARYAADGWCFDPALFLYCEDIDLSLRAHAAGRTVAMALDASIRHDVAASSGGEGNPLQHYYIARNRVALARRWLPLGRRLLFHAWYGPTRLVRVLQHRLAGRRDVASAILEGLRDGYAGRSGKWKRHP